MKPIVSDPPSDPIEIDPGVAYRYVIPVQGANSVDFMSSVLDVVHNGSDRFLDVTFNGVQTSAAQIFPLTILCSTDDGEVKHVVNFRVPRAADHFTPSLDILFLDEQGQEVYWNQKVRGTQDVDPAWGIDPASFLYVNWKVKFAVGLNTRPGFEGQTLFVKSLFSGYFKCSVTAGGAAVSDSGGVDQTVKMIIATCVDTDERIFVGDSSKFKVGAPFNFAYSDGAAIPSAFAGDLFVKEIVDAAHIKVSATVGGAAIASDADSFASEPGIYLIFNRSGRNFPAITSDPETVVAANAPVDYTITSDGDIAEFYNATLLPDGLAYSSGDHKITGTPTETGFFAIKLIAFLHGARSYRYWLLTVGAAGLATAPKPDVVLDLVTRRIYDLDGNRADRLDVVLGDMPQLVGFESFRDAAKLPKDSVFSFGMKPRASDVVDNGWDFDADTWLVYGSVNVTNDVAQISANEDWFADALAALFTDQRYLDFFGQFFWQLNGEARERASYPFLVRVYNRANRDTVPPDAPTTGSPEYYWSRITRLTGGVLATDLDAQPIAALPVNTIIKVKIVGRGESHWAKEAWPGPGDPASDTDAGIIKPVDWNAGAMNYVLNRVLGF